MCVHNVHKDFVASPEKIRILGNSGLKFLHDKKLEESRDTISRGGQALDLLGMLGGKMHEQTRKGKTRFKEKNTQIRFKEKTAQTLPK